MLISVNFGCICILTILSFINDYAHCQFYEKRSIHVNHLLQTTEFFHFPLSFLNFHGQGEHTDAVGDSRPIKYKPRLQGMPDLPKWIRHVDSSETDEGFIYGIPQKSGNLTLEVVALDTDSYQTTTKTVHLNIQERKFKSKYEVEMKLVNLNVDEIFLNGRLERLVSIFRKRLWKTGNSVLDELGSHGDSPVYITLVASPVDLGGRNPLDPSEKDGVVVRIGNTEEFSRDLLNLEKEVASLRNRVPCPKDYKKTSAERFFREEDFIPDWCSFKLYSDMRPKEAKEAAFTPIALSPDDVFESPVLILNRKREYFADFLKWVLVPVTAMIVLVFILSVIMFHRDSRHMMIEESSPDQVEQYVTIQRVSSTLRAMTHNRDASITPVSTLRRSNTNNQSVLEANSAYSTLRRCQPPPYYNKLDGYDVSKAQAT